MNLIQFLYCLSFIGLSIAENGYYNIYCGRENCYKLLGVDRDAPKAVIARSYRRLAAKYHPDRNKDPGALEIYRALSDAYEILRNEESRSEYNYFLDYPEHRYYNYYQYYQRSVNNVVDVRVVILSIIALISLCQYIAMKQNYHREIRDRMQDPKLNNQAKKIINERHLNINGNSKKKQKYIDITQDEYDLILTELITKSYEFRAHVIKPEMKSLFVTQLFLIPKHIYNYFSWNIRWIYLYNIKKQPYSIADREYLTYKNLNYKERQWLELDESLKTEFVNMELWIPENLREYNAILNDYTREKLANSGKHKMIKRYMKKGYCDQIQLDV